MNAAMHNLAIVLNRPKYAGNVGAAARCAKNMGMDRIYVVQGGNLPREEMLTMATHEAADLVDKIRYFDSLEEALAGMQYIVGATARTGSARGPFVSPRAMAKTVAELSPVNSIALLFGSEDRGLTNQDLRWCDLVVTIPTGAFKSINLSHAVMIICYEIFAAEGGPGHFAPKLATAGELAGMYGQLSNLLDKIDFLKPGNPEYWMRHIRRFFSRTRLEAKDVKIIRGICRQLEWYGDRGSKNP